MVVLIGENHAVIKEDDAWIALEAGRHEFYSEHRFARVRRLVPNDSVRLDVERHLAMVASTSSGA